MALTINAADLVIKDPSVGAGKVLTVDAVGKVTCQTPSAGDAIAFAFFLAG